MKNKYCKWCSFRHEDNGSKCIFDMDHTGQFHCVLDPTKAQMLDAAEFEAKVAVLLAQKNPITFPCDLEHCYVKESCAWCRLKAARIAVEEEMD